MWRARLFRRTRVEIHSLEHTLAVLIDFENIAAGTEKEGLGRFDIDAVLNRLKESGRVLIARAYGDWGRFSRFKQGLLTANVTMMELTSHGMQDKNRADIALVVDALELAYTRSYVDTFVVISGDSDFTPLVLKMRELNKRVIGCGTRKSTSRLLVNACDEFIHYDSLVATSRRERARPQSDAPIDLDTALELLVGAIAGLQRENPDPPLAGLVKTAMLRKSPDFSEGDLGYASFARFLEVAQTRGRVKVIRDPKAGGYRVELSEDDAQRDTRAPLRPQRNLDDLDALLEGGDPAPVEAAAAPAPRKRRPSRRKADVAAPSETAPAADLEALPADLDALLEG